MCRVPETMILCRSGLTGSVTHAWRMWVVIGTGTPAMAATSVLQPETHEITLPAEMVPRLVSTPTARPVHLRRVHHRVDRAVAVGEREVAELREQHVEVEVLRERLVQLHAGGVEAGPLGGQVVGADDGGVAPGRPGADVALLEHGHV